VSWIYAGNWLGWISRHPVYAFCYLQPLYPTNNFRITLLLRIILNYYTSVSDAISLIQCTLKLFLFHKSFFLFFFRTDSMDSQTVYRYF